MRKHLLLSPLIVLMILPLGLAGLKIEAVVTETLPPAETQADFDLMRKALEEAHTGLYRFSTKSQMDRAFDAQRAKLNRPMTKAEFLVVLAETLAQIRCGHTGLTPDNETQMAKARVRVPMYEYWNAVPGYDGKRRGTRPDHMVETKAANLLRGVDEQLELALKLATQALNQGQK